MLSPPQAAACVSTGACVKEYFGACMRSLRWHARFFVLVNESPNALCVKEIQAVFLCGVKKRETETLPKVLKSVSSYPSNAAIPGDSASLLSGLLCPLLCVLLSQRGCGCD